MLVIWNTLLVPEIQVQLVRLDPRVVFWPASWMKDAGYSSAVPIEWWISFSSKGFGSWWVLGHPEECRVVYFD